MPKLLEHDSTRLPGCPNIFEICEYAQYTVLVAEAVDRELQGWDEFPQASKRGYNMRDREIRIQRPPAIENARSGPLIKRQT